MIHRLLLILTLLLGLAGASNPQTEEPVRVVWTQVEYQFGQPVVISAAFEAVEDFQSTTLCYLSPGKPVQRQSFAMPKNLEVDLVLSEPQVNLRTFTTIYYWFEFKLSSEEVFTTPSFTFNYTDNRYDWQTLEGQQLTVFWYQEDPAFGQEAIDVAVSGLARMETFLPLTLPENKLTIYIYHQQKDLLDALALTGTTWVTAYSIPDLSIALVSIKPDANARMEMERQIPHELTHLMLYQKNPYGYDNLPTWLVEGLASAVELYPNSNYTFAFQEAIETSSLIPLADLCRGMPQNPERVELAYAESRAFIIYLHNRYGRSGMENLLNHYYDGKGCSGALSAAFGESLEALEKDWLSEHLAEAEKKTADQSDLKTAGVLCGAIVLPILFIGGYLWFKFKRSKETMPS